MMEKIRNWDVLQLNYNFLTWKNSALQPHVASWFIDNGSSIKTMRHEDQPPLSSLQTTHAFETKGLRERMKLVMRMIIVSVKSVVCVVVESRFKSRDSEFRGWKIYGLHHNWNTMIVGWSIIFSKLPVPRTWTRSNCPKLKSWQLMIICLTIQLIVIKAWDDCVDLNQLYSSCRGNTEKCGQNGDQLGCLLA